MKATILSFFIFTTLITRAQQVNMPVDTIEGYFKKVKIISDNDAGRLWGKRLYGSILVIDRQSRMIVANEPDNENLLKKSGNVYTGFFPENLIISNSTTQFGGKLWTMVSFPFYVNDKEIDLLFIHESFHYLQKKIGLKDNGYDNSHMNSADARIYLKLEWLALLSAVNSEKKNPDAVSDALLFREYRRSLYAGGDSMENKFEIAEGLAEYTAYTLCFRPEQLDSAVTARKNLAWNSDSYVRSFGYYSGLLYGYLLDKYQIDWRKNIKYNTDLGTELQNALDISLPGNITEVIKTKRNKYGFDTISVFEQNRFQAKEKIITAYRQKFTSDSVLRIPLFNAHFGFDPSTLQPLDAMGTIFPHIELVDEWGKLKVSEGGCLISNDWKLAVISSSGIKKSDIEITGNGWSLQLNDKWEMTEVKGNFQFLLKKK